MTMKKFMHCKGVFFIFLFLHILPMSYQANLPQISSHFWRQNLIDNTMHGCGAVRSNEILLIISKRSMKESRFPIGRFFVNRAGIV